MNAPVYAYGYSASASQSRQPFFSTGTFTMPDGSVYSGMLKDGLRHGNGSLTYTLDGRPSVPGLDYSWNAGDRYDGGWKDGVRHGACRYTFFNGEVFDCTWYEGMCHAFSARQRTLLEQDRKKPFASGFSRRVKFKYSSGIEYEGEWLRNEHGHGKMYFPNGDFYDGFFKNGKYDGKGLLRLADGTSYEGDFVEDEKHGRGVEKYASNGKTARSGLDFTWNAGDEFDGGFSRSVRHGPCTYTFFNGERFECTWQHGRCAEFNAQQSIVIQGEMRCINDTMVRAVSALVAQRSLPLSPLTPCPARPRVTTSATSPYLPDGSQSSSP
jgi:hypothetical protein